VIRSKLGLKALGLCAMVLGLMAIGTGAAQAEKGAHWNLNGNPITSTLLPEIGALLEGSHGVLLSKALGSPFKILCTAMTFEESKLLLEGSALGRIRFSGCKIFLSEKESIPCEPHTGTEKGVILTNLLKGLITLHEETLEGVTKNEPVVTIEPDIAGQPFVNIVTSAECSVGGKAGIPVIGKFVLSDCLHKGRTEAISHLGIELPTLTKLWILSETVEHQATIDGSASVFLVGEHLDTEKNKFLWSGTPA